MCAVEKKNTEKPLINAVSPGVKVKRSQTNCVKAWEKTPQPVEP